MATPGENNATTPTVSASSWRVAQVVQLRPETPTARTLVLQLPHPVSHLPGQRYELRLTAADGYQAARPYSAASPSDGRSDRVEITVVGMPEGEVSPYLVDTLQVGDQLELRGPFGKFFVWQPGDLEPVLLVGGGSGIAPLRCIWRAHALTRSSAALQLVYATRYQADIIYHSELLADPAHVTISLSREQSPDWPGARGRISEALLAQTLAALPPRPRCYVCGMNAFVEVATGMLQRLGVPPADIMTERFGVAL